MRVTKKCSSGARPMASEDQLARRLAATLTATTYDALDLFQERGSARIKPPARSVDLPCIPSGFTCCR